MNIIYKFRKSNKPLPNRKVNSSLSQIYQNRLIQIPTISLQPIQESHGMTEIMGGVIFNIEVNPIDLTNEIGDILERISISMAYEDMYGNEYNNYSQEEMS